MENDEIKQELDKDMDDAFSAAASELGIEIPQTEEEDDEEGQELQEAEGQGQEEVLDEEEEPAEDDAMPQSWGKKDADAWGGMNRDARQRVKQREAELYQMLAKKTSEAESVIAPLKSVLREIEPLVKEWRAEGKTRDQGLLQAVALYQHIKSGDKLELAKQFLAASGKKPEDLIDTPLSSRDRENRELRERVEMLESGIGEVTQERQMEPVRRLFNNLEGEFGAFVGTKNAFGSNKYPSANNPNFARAMGSLVTRLTQEVPDAQPSQLVQIAYERLGGQIDNGQFRPSSSKNNQDTQTLKNQARSGFGKGKSFTGQKVKYDNADDAWNATLAEFDLLE